MRLVVVGYTYTNPAIVYVNFGSKNILRCGFAQHCRRFFQKKINQHPHAARFLCLRQVIEVNAGIGSPVVAQYGAETVVVALLRADVGKEAADADTGADGIRHDVDVVADEGRCHLYA